MGQAETPVVPFEALQIEEQAIKQLSSMYGAANVRIVKKP